MITRIAIVNRGEAAMRLIHSVRELNAQGGKQIETVALYTDGERSAMFVREADSAYALGPAVDRPYLDWRKHLPAQCTLEAAARARTPGLFDDWTNAHRAMSSVGPSATVMRTPFATR